MSACSPLARPSSRKVADRIGHEIAFLERFKFCKSLELVADAKGNPSAVLVPLAEFKRLVADMEALSVAATATAQDSISFEEMQAELRRDGVVPPNG
jgi:hypothetical protein